MTSAPELIHGLLTLRILRPRRSVGNDITRVPEPKPAIFTLNHFELIYATVIQDLLQPALVNNYVS